MFPADMLDQLYDDSVKLGLPLLSFSLFDRRVLFPRSMILDVIQSETDQHMTLDEVDSQASAGLFEWYGGAGDGTEIGVPLYLPSRIGLCSELLKKRWTLTELRDFVEWEEWIVDDTLSDGLSYEDDDRALIAREARRQIESLNEEIWGRLPVEDQPEGWSRHSWSSALQARTLPDLERERDRLLRFVSKLERTDTSGVSDQWKHEVGRQAFHIRSRDEWLRVVTILSDRRKIEAGFSHAVQFSGQRSAFPDDEDFESFGRVDWHGTLSNWRFLEDPDRFPIRLPGLVLIGGKVTLDELLEPSTYQARSELFRLSEYIELFKEATGEPRCANCSRMLKSRTSERRRYCSDHCSQAARQRAYRERQKAAILRRRGED